MQNLNLTIKVYAIKAFMFLVLTLTIVYLFRLDLLFLTFAEGNRKTANTEMKLINGETNRSNDNEVYKFNS